MPEASFTSIADPSQITLHLRRSAAGTMTSAAVLRTLKLTVFGVAVLLTLLGALLTAGGGYCAFLLRGAGVGRTPPAADPAAVLTTDAVSVVILSLTTGALLLVVGLLGCCGVAHSSRALLLGQAGALAVLLLLEVTTLSVVIWSERSAPRRAELAALELIRRRGSAGAAPGTSSAWRAMHAVQRRLRCCGVLGYGDYVSVNATVPVSCCRDENPSASTPERCDFSGLTAAQLQRHPLLHRRGCGALVRRRLHLLAALAYVLCGLTLAAQMAALTVSCYVALSMREAYPAIHSSVQSLRSSNRMYD